MNKEKAFKEVKMGELALPALVFSLNIDIHQK